MEQESKYIVTLTTFENDGTPPKKRNFCKSLEVRNTTHFIAEEDALSNEWAPIEYDNAPEAFASRARAVKALKVIYPDAKEIPGQEYSYITHNDWKVWIYSVEEATPSTEKQKMKTIQMPDHLSDIIPPEFDEKYEYALGPAEEWGEECKCEAWVCQKNPSSGEFEKKWKHGGREVYLRFPSMIYRRLKKKDRWALIPPEEISLGDKWCTAFYFQGIENSPWIEYIGETWTHHQIKNRVVIRKLEEKS